jgi:hypothetical protein
MRGSWPRECDSEKEREEIASFQLKRLHGSALEFPSIAQAVEVSQRF